MRLLKKSYWIVAGIIFVILAVIGYFISMRRFKIVDTKSKLTDVVAKQYADDLYFALWHNPLWTEYDTVKHIFSLLSSDDLRKVYNSFGNRKTFPFMADENLSWFIKKTCHGSDLEMFKMTLQSAKLW